MPATSSQQSSFYKASHAACGSKPWERRDKRPSAWQQFWCEIGGRGGITQGSIVIDRWCLRKNGSFRIVKKRIVCSTPLGALKTSRKTSGVAFRVCGQLAPMQQAFWELQSIHDSPFLWIFYDFLPKYHLFTLPPKKKHTHTQNSFHVRCRNATSQLNQQNQWLEQFQRCEKYISAGTKSRTQSKNPPEVVKASRKA